MKTKTFTLLAMVAIVLIGGGFLYLVDPLTKPYDVDAEIKASITPSPLPKTRVVTIPNSDVVFIPDTTWRALSIEDTCKEGFKRTECIKIVTTERPVVDQKGNSWEITFIHKP